MTEKKLICCIGSLPVRVIILLRNGNGCIMSGDIRGTTVLFFLKIDNLVVGSVHGKMDESGDYIMLQ